MSELLYVVSDVIQQVVREHIEAKMLNIINVCYKFTVELKDKQTLKTRYLVEIMKECFYLQGYSPCLEKGAILFLAITSSNLN